MPRDINQKYAHGDKRINSQFLNELGSMRQEWKRGQFSTKGPPKTGGFSPDVVTIRNDSGAGVDQFGILGLGDPIWTAADDLEAFKNDLIFKGLSPVVLPTVASATNVLGHAGRFAVCIEPIPKDGVGDALCGGIVQVQLEVDVDADYQFADPIAGDTNKLRAAFSGSARILHRPTGTGTKWGVIAIDGREQHAERWATFTGSGTWTKGASLTLKVLDPTLAATGQSITAYNDFLDVEYDNSKIAYLIGRGRKMVLLAVDPCAPE